MITFVAALTLTFCSIIVFSFIESGNSHLKFLKQYTNASIISVQSASGNNPIFINTHPAMFLIEGTNPMLEYQDIIPFRLAPLGWVVGSPLYKRFLEQMGLENSAAFILHTVDNDQAIYYHWFENDPELHFFTILRRHLNDRYGSMFPGKAIDIQIFQDCRIILDGEMAGWIFYKIITTEGLI